MKTEDLFGLFWHFLLLSAIGVGGMHSVIPDIQRYVVEQNGWFTPRQFGEIYALAQVIPGPNVMLNTMIGWLVAGWQGAAVITIALFIPGSIMAAVLIRMGVNNPNSRGAHSLRRGLAPLIIGLSASTAWIMFSTLSVHWHWMAGALLTAFLVTRTRLNPLWLIGLGALAGMTGLV